MANEVTVPILPCRSIDEIVAFYQMLGFTQTYVQRRPNPYVALRRDDIELHFAGIPEFDPSQSYGSCLVLVDDTWELYHAFAAGMRAVHGKLLVAGIPRLTRPRRRANVEQRSGFTVVDPGGNWIRFFARARTSDAPDVQATPPSPLARALQAAIVLGDSKGDVPQAARVLDLALDRIDASHAVTERVEALVYRAELAVRLGDPALARRLLADVAHLAGDGTDRASLTDALANAQELTLALGPNEA